MDTILEIIFEFIFELIFASEENIEKTCVDKNTSKGVRYLLLALITFVYLSIIGVLFGFAIIVFDETPILSLIIIAIIAFIIIVSVKKFRRMYLARK